MSDGEFMDEMKQSEIDAIIENFISRFPRRSLRMGAAALNIRKQRMHDYVVHRYNPRESLLHKMQAFCGEGAMGLKKDEQSQSTVDLIKPSILEMADMAQSFMNEFKPPRGRKKIQNGVKKEVMCKNSCTLNEKKSKKERFDAQVAKEFGFKNATTLRQILKIYKKNCVALNQAINEKRILIDAGYELLSLSVEERTSLLQQEDEVIRAYAADQKKSRQEKRSLKASIKKVLAIAERHRDLIDAENETGKPIRKIFEDILYSARC